MGVSRLDAATARAIDGIAPGARVQPSSHSNTNAMPRVGNVVHLPLPPRGEPSSVEGYTAAGWGGIITITPITDSQHPADAGAAELVVTERGDAAELVPAGQTGELMRVRLPAAPDGDIAVLLAEAEEHLSARTSGGGPEHRQARWERGANGTWRAAVSDLILLAVETASMPAPARAR